MTLPRVIPIFLCIMNRASSDLALMPKLTMAVLSRGTIILFASHNGRKYIYFWYWTITSLASDTWWRCSLLRYLSFWNGWKSIQVTPLTGMLASPICYCHLQNSGIPWITSRFSSRLPKSTSLRLYLDLPPNCSCCSLPFQTLVKIKTLVISAHLSSQSTLPVKKRWLRKLMDQAP